MAKRYRIQWEESYTVAAIIEADTPEEAQETLQDVFNHFGDLCNAKCLSHLDVNVALRLMPKLIAVECEDGYTEEPSAPELHETVVSGGEPNEQSV